MKRQESSGRAELPVQLSAGRTVCYRVFLLDEDRKWNYSACLSKDINLKPLMHLTDNAQNNSISCCNPCPVLSA